MGGLGRYRWFATAGAVSLAFAAVCLTAHRSAGLTAFSDIFGFVAMLVAGGIMVANAMIRPGRERWFWGLMAAGLVGWTLTKELGCIAKWYCAKMSLIRISRTSFCSST